MYLFFLLLLVLLLLYLRNHCLTLLRFTICFLLIAYSLALTFVFVFWVIFAYHIRYRSRSILLHVDICLNTICWKKMNPSSIELPWYLCSKQVDRKRKRFCFWTLELSVSVVLLEPYCLDIFIVVFLLRFFFLFCLNSNVKFSLLNA